jgi:4-hydroxyphenylpyruvate dioxygenase-like putative hemolysin
VYYEMLEERPARPRPAGGELQARGILLDGRRGTASSACCCRSSRHTLLGPVFFEFIQRKGDDGFGEGNFKALFSRSSATRCGVGC